MTTTTEPKQKLRVDMADLTLGELADIAEMVGASLVDAMQGPQQPRGIAAIACIIRRREDPSFSYEDALRLRMSDIEIVNSGEDETAPKGENGDGPRSSPASGLSTP